MLRFSRPKGPGFGISGGFYLSVLATHARLPSLLSIVNPAGGGGAVTGFGVPLADDATKDALGAPLERGAYGIASKDKKTVLRMMVVSKEEAGFDTETVARYSESLGISGELLNRIRATWTLLQLRFESHDPAVYPALDFLLAIAVRLAELTDGAIADPICRRYLLPDQAFAKPRLDPHVDVREHVAVHANPMGSAIRVFTLGLQKFALPEVEIQNLSVGQEKVADSFLLNLGQRILLGSLLRTGQRLGEFEVIDGGFDRALWEGIPCLELRPRGMRTADEALTS